MGEGRVSASVRTSSRIRAQALGGETMRWLLLACWAVTIIAAVLIIINPGVDGINQATALIEDLSKAR